MSASLFGRGARTTPSRILDLQENSHEHCSNLIIQMVLFVPPFIGRGLSDLLGVVAL